MARTPDISPDGKLVAFSYLGDIWVVETIGGTARPVTMHRAHDIFPCFSPDGRYIAFSSNRHGSYDVYVVPSHGGKPRRLTHDSAHDFVSGWAPDGKQILFHSTRSMTFPPNAEVYAVSVDGGQPRRISSSEGRDAVCSPAGDKIAYVRGPGAWYRKGYRGSSNDQIWIANIDGSNNQQLTAFNGQNGSPMWSADGQWIYYVSEVHGTPANLVRLPATAVAAPAKATPQQVTFHKDEAVRRARISSNGCWVVYECGPDLWVVSTREGASPPRKLAIEVYADDKSNTERVETFTQNATEFALSADEKHIAFAVHGELFVMPIATSAKVTRLTHSTAYNHGMAWAPDNTRILFVSDRDGHDNIYSLQPDDSERPRMGEARRFKTTQLTTAKEAASGLSFAPDGKRVAFLRGGKLWSMNPDGSDPKAIINEVQVFDYDWSPDSKWLVYARRDGFFASELYIVPSTGPTADNPIRNMTRYATYNGDITWSANGKRIAFLSVRRGTNTTSLWVTSLQKPAAPGVADKTVLSGTAAPVEFDWDDLHLRAKLVLPVPVDTAAISPDGTKVAFRASSGGTGDLWLASIDGSQVMRLTTGGQEPRQIQWSRRRDGLGRPIELIYFRDGSGQIRMARPRSDDKSETQVAAIPFQVKMTVKAEEEFTEMFDQAWRFLAENFYDSKFHGADWDAVRARYRPLVKHVALKEDLYSLLYLMMGELNASHLGVSGPSDRIEEPTADLGLIFDDSYKGRGLKIAEILKRGPADKRGVNLKAGDVVLAIDGVELTPAVELSTLLNGKANEMVVLEVTSNPMADPKDPKARRRAEIQAMSRAGGRGQEDVRELMYDRWVAQNARRVAELSKGKLGYIHIPSMDEEGLDKFVRALYSDNFDKDGIVLDVRFNGGGFTHDQVLNYLGAREHTVFRQRDGGEGWVLRAYDRKWTRPLVLVINNRSYSDAEIFPNAFRTLGLGKLVGQPTGGHVIGTTAVRLIDGSTFRIPRTGVFTMKGVNMDKEGVMPDVLIETHPDQLARGVDAQLERAVAVLQDDVVQWKKKGSASVVVNPEVPGKPAPLPPMPPSK